MTRRRSSGGSGEVPSAPLLLALEQEPRLQGALVTLDPGTGYVGAIVGGYDFEASEFNRAFQACRQPGSAFKPILYAAAIEKLSFTPSTLLTDAPVVFRALPRSWRSRVATAMATGPFAPLFTDGGTRTERARQRVRYLLATTAFNSFPLPRSTGFRASLEYAGELADRCVSTLIFPEGRMTTTGELGPLRAICAQTGRFGCL